MALRITLRLGLIALTLIALTHGILSVAVAASDDGVADGDCATSSAQAQQIVELIAQLSHANFGEREHADAKLRTSGREAVAHLQELVGGRDLDASVRAVGILKALALSPDAECANARWRLWASWSRTAGRLCRIVRPKPCEGSADCLSIGCFATKAP